MTSLLRLAGVALLVWAWFGSQKWLGQRGLPKAGIGDRVHQWMTPLHQFLERRPWAVRMLLISSSLGIDLLGLSVLYQGVFGASFRPIVGLALLLLLRQTSQYLCALPAPEGMIWRHPGVPSLFVTYHVENDLFFSGHTAFAVYGTLVLSQVATPGGVLALALLASYEILAVLALRAHWTMDVYAGAVSALLVYLLTCC